jgi:ParB family transcriptional regulator, chromosome partitioning protein
MAKKKASTTQKRKKLALGRGFDAFLPEIETETDDRQPHDLADIRLIQPNRYQPRRRFAPEELKELSASIKSHGILQPLLVRRDDAGFELVAGERRLRAAKMAGLTEVPVLVKNISDTEMLEISIIENIQREDLNPMEEADAYHRLMKEFELTQEQVADRVGKSRPAVANFLRLRQLPAEIKKEIINGSLSMGHARALLGAENRNQQLAAWRTVAAKGLSVRETEALIKRLKNPPEKPDPAPPSSDEIYMRDLADNLSRDFGTRVSINRRGKKGRLEIEFYSDADLDRILVLLRR